MSLSSIPYMRWAKASSDQGELTLTMSAVPALTWEELGFDPSRLELCSFTPYGPDALRDGIAGRWQRGPEEVLLAASATHAHFCLAASGLAPGRRVLYESPGYLPLVDSLSVLGIAPIRFRRRAADAFALPAEELRRLVERARPCTLLVTNLHNPSGVALKDGDVDLLLDLAETSEVEIIVDETYRPFLDPDPGPLYLRHPRIISVWGLNKVHGLPLIRVGWGMAPPERVEMARRVLDATTVHNSCLSDQVALHAVAEMPRLEERARGIARRGWEIARPWLERSPLEFVAPAAGLICFPRVPEELFADTDVLRDALLEVGVGITPGRFFEEPQHFRLSVASPPEKLGEALRRFSQVLDRHRTGRH